MNWMIYLPVNPKHFIEFGPFKNDTMLAAKNGNRHAIEFITENSIPNWSINWNKIKVRPVNWTDRDSIKRPYKLSEIYHDGIHTYFEKEPTKPAAHSRPHNSKKENYDNIEGSIPTKKEVDGFQQFLSKSRTPENIDENGDIDMAKGSQYIGNILDDSPTALPSSKSERHLLGNLLDEDEEFPPLLPISKKRTGGKSKKQRKSKKIIKKKSRKNRH
jgi:hypothetical protein